MQHKLYKNIFYSDRDLNNSFMIVGEKWMSKKVINIKEKDFGGRLRCGDILALCNMLENLRKDDMDLKIY